MDGGSSDASLASHPGAIFERTVDEGERRLRRSSVQLCATGAVGGMDVAIGVLALLVVEQETGNRLLGALAFTIGFVALTLAKSELFTENFLVPIAALVARRAPWSTLVRLWIVTLVFNLAAGWVFTGLIVVGLPHVRPTARVVGGAYPALGLGQAFALAMLAGVAITLLTWMDHSTESVPARLVAAVSVAFLLAAPPLNHSIVGSLEMFAALHAHASFGYLAWAKVFGWAVLGNAVGGIGLVTVLRLVQVGPDKIQEERVDAAGTSNLVVAGRSPSRPDGSSDGKF